MKFFVIIIHFFYIQLSHTISSPDLLSFLRTYLTPSNHKLEASVFRSTLLNYDSLPSSQKEAFQANDNLGVNSFLLTHRNFYSQKPKLKEIITFFPKILFSNSSNNEFSISESFESFLEELETTYTEELVQDYDKKHLFSNESFKIFEDLLENEDKPNIKRKDVRKFDFLSQEHRDKFRDFMDEFFEKKLQHNSDIYLEKLDDNIAVHKNFYYNQTQKEKKKQDTTDSFYENLTEYKQVHNNMSQEALKQKFNELINHTKTLDTIIGEHNLSLTDLQAHIVEKPHEFLLGVSHFLNLELNLTEGNNTYFPNIQNLTQNNKSNYSDFNISFLKMKEEIIGVLNYSKNDRISLNNTNITIFSEPNDTNSKTMTNKTNNIKSKLKTNFLKTITYNETKNKKKTENVISFLQTKDDFLDALSTQDSDKKCISPEQKNAIASAFEDLSKLEASNNEDAETLLNKKEVSYGKSKAQISMQLKMIIQLIKMVINAIVAIITGFFRIIVPPAILAFFSCPEAAFFPVNLIHIINFDEKTEQLLKKIEAFPAFYETFTQPNSPNSLYYMCAQGF